MNRKGEIELFYIGLFVGYSFSACAPADPLFLGCISKEGKLDCKTIMPQLSIRAVFEPHCLRTDS